MPPDTVTTEITTQTTTQPTLTTTTLGQLSWNSTGITVATANGNTAILNPFGVFVDDNYYIYIAEKTHNRISKWPPNPTGSSSSAVFVTATGELNQPPSLYVDSTTGDIYVADETNRRVRRFANGSTTGTNVVSPSAGATPNVNAIFLSPNRTIYITDSGNFRIYDWLTNKTVAGGNGAGSSNTQLNSPKRFFIDNSYNFYIPENVNHRVMKWTLGASSGQVVAGGNGGGTAANQLNAPLAVAVSSQGDVLVCDTNNNRIQLWRVGAVTGETIAGDSGGSTGSTSTRLNSPKGIAIDKDDNIYVVDGNNYRIQKFNAIS